jgi:mRNA interferase MazF
MVRRDEIYFLNLSPAHGREQAGRRPVLVLSIDPINRLPLVETVVVGTKGENAPRDYPTNVRVAAADCGLPMETVFLGFQIRSLDAGRFPAAPAGQVSGAVLEQQGSALGCQSRQHRLGVLLPEAGAALKSEASVSAVLPNGRQWNRQALYCC